MYCSYEESASDLGHTGTGYNAHKTRATGTSLLTGSRLSATTHRAGTPLACGQHKVSHLGHLS